MICLLHPILAHSPLPAIPCTTALLLFKFLNQFPCSEDAPNARHCEPNGISEYQPFRPPIAQAKDVRPRTAAINQKGSRIPFFLLNRSASLSMTNMEIISAVVIRSVEGLRCSANRRYEFGSGHCSQLNADTIVETTD